MAVDPVCGMEMDEATAEWKSEHMGETYYFCAPGCKQAFDGNPLKFLEKEAGMGHGGHGHQGHD